MMHKFPFELHKCPWNRFKMSVIERFKLESYPPGEVITMEKDRASKMYVIKKGMVVTNQTIACNEGVIGKDFILNLILKEPRRSYGIMTSHITFADVFSLHIDDLLDIFQRDIGLKKIK